MNDEDTLKCTGRITVQTTVPAAVAAAVALVRRAVKSLDAVVILVYSVLLLCDVKETRSPPTQK